jgi:hypothetical protein
MQLVLSSQDDPDVDTTIGRDYALKLINDCTTPEARIVVANAVAFALDLAHDRAALEARLNVLRTP